MNEASQETQLSSEQGATGATEKRHMVRTTITGDTPTLTDAA